MLYCIPKLYGKHTRVLQNDHSDSVKFVYCKQIPNNRLPKDDNFLR